MGDMGDTFREFRDAKKKLRSAHGVPCPRCAVVRPKAHPSVLLPRQRCKVDGYVDPRARLTDEQLKAVGLTVVNQKGSK